LLPDPAEPRFPRRLLERATGILPGWVPLGALWVGVLFSLPGCTKLVPQSPEEVSVEQRVVATFADGRELRGRLDLDESVTLRTPEAVYRGRIVDINDEEITIGEIIPVRLLSEPFYEASRMADSRVRVQAGAVPGRVVLRRDELQEVRVVKTDGWKTTRQIGFWTSTGLAVLLLLLELS
jgi:predicted Zn-dependent protease with MMP-like domain